MDRRSSILDTLGEEIVRIVAPVSICMLLVVLLVATLSPSSSSAGSLTTIATIAYSESSSDSTWDKLEGTLLNSLVFVAVITVVTFLMVLLFYFKCTRFLKLYMGFSAFIVLGFMGGEIFLFLIKDLNFPIDCITFVVFLCNFTVVGVIAVFSAKTGILVTQCYLVAIGILVAYWFTKLPEWTTWGLLVAMALYDLAAVLLPGGPLRLLVELAMSREEDIPALVYEARPVAYNGEGEVDRPRVWSRDVAPVNSGPNSNSHSTVGDLLSASDHECNTAVANVEEGRFSGRADNGVIDVSAPLIGRGNRSEGEGDDVLSSGSSRIEGIGLGSSGAIKLGLGDFIFYSVLVGRAAMYDFMTVYACYLAIIAGLGVTLMLLALYRKALPALPVSILLGVVFYFLTRVLLEVFVVQCSVHLIMF